jgi:hypothetical protein
MTRLDIRDNSRLPGAYVRRNGTESYLPIGQVAEIGFHLALRKSFPRQANSLRRTPEKAFKSRDNSMQLHEIAPPQAQQHGIPFAGTKLRDIAEPGCHVIFELVLCFLQFSALIQSNQSASAQRSSPTVSTTVAGSAKSSYLESTTAANRVLDIAAADQTGLLSSQFGNALPEKPAASLASAHSSSSSPLPLQSWPKRPSLDQGKVGLKPWYGLVALQHTAAGFDAWSTRLSIRSGNGQEADPFVRPFAHSVAIYPAMQVLPTGLDILGRHLMHSGNPRLRKIWWLPQFAGTIAYTFSGVHNLTVARPAAAAVSH